MSQPEVQIETLKFKSILKPKWYQMRRRYRWWRLRRRVARDFRLLTPHAKQQLYLEEQRLLFGDGAPGEAFEREIKRHAKSSRGIPSTPGGCPHGA